MLSLLVVIVFAYSSVFRRRYYTLNEYFDQFTIMLCTCNYSLFTDYVEDPLMRYYAGYSLIAICCVNLAVHLYHLISHTISEIILVYKWRRYRYYVKLLMEDIKANRIRERKAAKAGRRRLAMQEDASYN